MPIDMMEISFYCEQATHDIKIKWRWFIEIRFHCAQATYNIIIARDIVASSDHSNREIQVNLTNKSKFLKSFAFILPI